MTLRVRDLLARVSIYRPDVIKEKGEEYGLWCIQEAVRDVCRYTGLAVEQVIIPLAANSHFTQLTSTGNEVFKIIGVSAANLPGSETSPTTYLGTFNATTGYITPAELDVTIVHDEFDYPWPLETFDEPDPTSTLLTDGSASGTQVNGFYICNVPGSFQVDNIINTWQQWDNGDVILSDGVYWKQYKKDGFSTIGITSKTSIDHWFNSNQSPRNFPAHVAQEADFLHWYPPTRYDTALRLAYSVVPNLIDWTTTNDIAVRPNSIEMETIPLPIEAESTILNGALEMMFRTPHPDPKLMMFYSKQADAFHIKFMKGKTGLRAMSLLGSSGSAWYAPANFAGRTNKFTPWRSENWWL